MLDLKNCPFCDGKATLHSPHGALGAWISCAGCGLEGPTETGVTEDEAIAAWNRRALHVVGPEPVSFSNGPVMAQLSYGEFLSWIADRMVHIHGENPNFDYILRLREIAAWLAAPVVAPPAEPVVEAPQPANSVRKAAERVVSFDWSSNDPDAVAAVDALRAALAAKPAVKDDETVVEARKRLERAGGAMSNILYNLKQDPTFAEALRDRIAECQEEWDAALAAKEGRS